VNEHIVKPCPRCGKLLEIRRNCQTGEEFLGCAGWRSPWEGCQYISPLPEAITLRRAGQKGMFDDEEAQPCT
jgi:ssDNA-binding Zn-finger/Zn-ribbon topoisomerase 1